MPALKIGNEEEDYVVLHFGCGDYTYSEVDCFLLFHISLSYDGISPTKSSIPF